MAATWIDHSLQVQLCGHHCDFYHCMATAYGLPGGGVVVEGLRKVRTQTWH